MARVELSNIVKDYPGNIRAVDGVSLSIKHGEFLVIVGPSGCGKTTTLRLVAGLEAVTNGAIRIDDRDVTQLAPKDRDIAMVFQNYALWPHMTVRQNLSFGLRLRNGIGPVRMLSTRLFRRVRYRQLREVASDIDRRVSETAKLLGIEDLLERKPRELSGGQQQRVAVGRALVRRPKVFLFDEPLSNLDAVLRVELRRELRRLHRQLGATMIYVTHDQTEAMTLGTRIAVMEGGRLRQLAEPLVLYERPADKFVAGFVGSPPMNFINGRLIREDSALWFEGQGLRMALGAPWSEITMAANHQPVQLGIRPEHVTLKPTGTELAAIEGCVALTEPLGHATIVHLAVGSATITVQADAHDCPIVGTRVGAFVSRDHIHLFDTTSGRSLATV